MLSNMPPSVGAQASTPFSVPMTRRPKNYLGLNHTTLGSDILAVLRAVHAPELALGAPLAARLREIDPPGWYPIDLQLEIFAALDARLGRPALVSMGWGIVQNSHAENIRKNSKSVRDLLYGFDDLYHRANRGHRIGGWQVVRFEPGLAELEKTTPHHCVVEEGIVEEALRTVGVKCEVTQPECFRQGAELCRYLIRSSIRDSRWQPV